MHLVLTKPLGTGIIATAIKADEADEATIRRAIGIMSELNAKAARLLDKYDIHACTDITGFGLLGHICEMIEGDSTAVMIFSDKTPVLSQALELASMGYIPAGAYRNRDFRMKMVENMIENIDLFMCLNDPQTSGGLLVVLKEEDAVSLVVKRNQPESKPLP